MGEVEVPQEARLEFPVRHPGLDDVTNADEAGLDGLHRSAFAFRISSTFISPFLVTPVIS
ncbi:MAG: hypothetical protein ACRDTA_10995 [Pseudonocardiaceae bacterium]